MATTSFAQSKKVIIQQKTAELDSLTQVYNNEKVTHQNEIKNLDSTLQKLMSKARHTQNRLDLENSKRLNLSDEIKFKQSEIKNLKSKIKKLEDELKPEIPEKLCFSLTTNTLEEVIEIHFSPKGNIIRVQGTIMGEINDEENGYYTSYYSDFQGEMNGDILNVNVMTEIEGYEEEDKEEWDISKDLSTLSRFNGDKKYKNTSDNCK